LVVTEHLECARPNLTRAPSEKYTLVVQGLVQKCKSISAFYMDYTFKCILDRKLNKNVLKLILPVYTLVWLQGHLKSPLWLTLYFYWIVLLLENTKLEHRLGNPRYIHLGNCATFVLSL